MQFFHFGTGNQLIQQINSGYCMQYSDSVERVFVAHDSITQSNHSNYSAILSCTPNGATTALADFALKWGSIEIAGTTYWGFYCYLSSPYTQIAGPMACNLVVSNLTQVIVSQTFSIMVNAASSSTDWSESITQAQWKELMNYVSGLKIPNLGTVDFVLGTAGSIIDNYYGSANAGAYYFTDTSGESYLLLVGYSGTTTTQSLYYIDTAENVFVTAQRTYNSGATTPEWSTWSERAGYLPISGGTMLGPVNFGNYSSTWVNGTNSAVMNPTYLEFATSAGTTMYEYGEILFNGFAFALPAITEDSILATQEWVTPQTIGKANKIAFTNLVVNGNFASSSNWVNWNSATFTVSGNVATITPTAIYGGVAQGISALVNGHVYYMACNVSSATDSLVLIRNISSSCINVIGDGSYHYANVEFTYPNATGTFERVIVETTASTPSPINLQYFVLIDLTAVYGAGNEPSASVISALLNSKYASTLGWFDGTAYVKDLIDLDIELNSQSSEIANLTPSIGSANLLNMSASGVTKGYYLSVGVPVANSKYNISDFIEVSPSSSYIFPVSSSFFGISTGACWYDENKNLMSGVSVVSSAVVSTAFGTINKVICATAPANAKYLKISYGYTNAEDTPFFAKPYLPAYMVIQGSDPTLYPYSFVYYKAPTSALSESVSLSKAQIGQIDSTHENPLYGKTILFDGDSICQALTAGNTDGGWAKRIGDNNGASNFNLAVGGGTIAVVANRHNVCTSVLTYAGTPDYVIVEGGTNDSANNVALGALSATDFGGSYDNTTFIGALEYMFYNILAKWPSAKVGYIIPQKMNISTYYDSPFNQQRLYFEVAMKVCKKWGIPFINLWDGCPLNPKLACFYTSGDTTKAYYDGQHLNSAGYDIITPYIEQWLKSGLVTPKADKVNQTPVVRITSVATLPDYFSVTGAGTSASPYIAMPKDNYDYNSIILSLTINAEPTQDVYIQFKSSGNQKVKLILTRSGSAFSTYQYYINFINDNGSARYRYRQQDSSMLNAYISTLNTYFSATIDINDPSVYSTY